MIKKSIAMTQRQWRECGQLPVGIYGSCCADGGSSPRECGYIGNINS